MKSRTWIWIILGLSFFGLADASYLTQHALAGTPLLCDIQNLSGCNIVASSQYSRLFGVPLALYGVVFYGMLFVLSALELVIVDRLVRRIIQWVAALGFLSSLYFIGVQIFLIGAFCVYCFASAIISVLVLGFATVIEPIRRRDKETKPLSARLFPNTGPKIPFAPPEKPDRTDSFKMPPGA